MRRLVIAGCAALSGLAAYAVFNAAAQGSALDSRVRALSAQNAALQQQIDERRQQVGEANDVAWLEEQARRLGLVFPGETVYIITPPGASTATSGGLNAPLPTYAPSPTPSPSPSPGTSPTPKPTPTPVPLVIGSPSPSPSPSPH